MKIFQIILILLFAINITSASGKDKLIAIRQEREQGFSFYDYEGKLRFTLPPGHDPAVRADFEPYYLDNFYIIDFTDHPLAVRHDPGFYLIDAKGKTIKTFEDAYGFISSFQNGYLWAERSHSDDHRSIEYYDTRGMRSFGEAEYYTGGMVINDKALVRIYQPGVKGYLQKGDWVIVDKEGNVVKNISANAEGELFRFYMPYDYQWNLTVTSSKKGSNLYILPDGQMSFHSFQSTDQIKTLQLYKAADSIGRTKDPSLSYKMGFWPTAIVNNKLIFLGAPTSGDGKEVLFDQYQKQIILEKDGHTIIPQFFMGDGQFVFTVEMEGDKIIAYPVFDLKTLSVSAILNKRPHDKKEDLFIYYVQGDPRSMIEKIVTLTGKTIFQLDINQRFITDISEAIKYRDQIKNVKFSGVTFAELESLGILKNLESFELSGYSDKSLPKNLFNQWGHLVTMRFTDCKDLSLLPLSVGSLKKLRRINILSCPNLKGFESWFELWPSLKTVKTDLMISPELRKKFPNIVFEETLVEMKE